MTYLLYTYEGLEPDKPLTPEAGRFCFIAETGYGFSGFF